MNVLFSDEFDGVEGSFDDLTKLEKNSDDVSEAGFILDDAFEAVDDSSVDDFTEYDKNSDIFVFDDVDEGSYDDLTKLDKKSDDVSEAGFIFDDAFEDLEALYDSSADDFAE